MSVINTEYIVDSLSCLFESDSVRDFVVFDANHLEIPAMPSDE